MLPASLHTWATFRQPRTRRASSASSHVLMKSHRGPLYRLGHQHGVCHRAVQSLAVEHVALVIGRVEVCTVPTVREGEHEVIDHAQAVWERRHFGGVVRPLHHRRQMVGGDVAEEVVRVPEVRVARSHNRVVRGSTREWAVSNKLSEARATTPGRYRRLGLDHCMQRLSAVVQLPFSQSSLRTRMQLVGPEVVERLGEPTNPLDRRLPVGHGRSHDALKLHYRDFEVLHIGLQQG